jgi:hypothetical protein
MITIIQLPTRTVMGIVGATPDACVELETFEPVEPFVDPLALLGRPTYSTQLLLDGLNK